MWIPQDHRSSNTVGFDERKDMPELNDYDASRIALMKKALMREGIYLPFDNPLWLKKFLERDEHGTSDAIQGAQHSFNTSPQEDALLRQSSLDDEPSLDRKFDDGFWKGDTAEKWRRSHFGKL
jgi:hypothetical protein